MGDILFAERKIGSASLRMYGILLGDDLCFVLSGGDRPHMGAAVLSQPWPAGKAGRKKRATTSVLALIGHKEDELFRRLAEKAAAETGGNVVVCGGIHVDNADTELIGAICQATEEMLAELLVAIRRRPPLQSAGKGGGDN